MTTVDKIKSLISAISKRGIGHTELMKQGTMHYDRPFAIVANTMDSAKRLAEGSDLAKPVTISTLNQLIGTDLPVAIDHYQVQELLQSALIEISDRDFKLQRAMTIQEKMMTLVELYQNRAHEIESISMDLLTCKWWNVKKIISTERKLHKAILKYNTEYDGIAKTFDTLSKIAKHTHETTNS
jgi:hypothetical protein